METFSEFLKKRIGEELTVAKDKLMTCPLEMVKVIRADVARLSWFMEQIDILEREFNEVDYEERKDNHARTDRDDPWR